MLTAEQKVEASIDYTPYEPGRLTGTPEYCYRDLEPPEGGDWDLETLIHKPTGIDLVPHLTQNEAAQLEIILKEQWDEDND